MDDLKRYYESNIENYGMPKRRAEAIVSLLDKKLKGLKILDIGCGEGLFGKSLKNKGAEVVGIDISKKAIKKAKKNLSDAIVVDLNSQILPFKQGSFDLVIASEVIEHLFDPQKLLNEVNKVLKKGGCLIITTPNILYWGHRITLLRGKFVYQDSGPFDRGHIHFYTYPTLLNALKKSRFKVEKEQHIFLGSKGLKLLERFFPSLFAYQFVLACQKY